MSRYAKDRLGQHAAGGTSPGRPAVTGRESAVSSGHPLATLAAMRILDKGGNAVDAGVAAGLALGVLQPDIVGCVGVAPIILYLAETKEVVTISGLGRWPRAASVRYFNENCGGELPLGVLRSLVPAAPDAWLTALERYGTMRFGEVAEAAHDLATEGFATHRLLCATAVEEREYYALWPSSAEVFLPGGEPHALGERFVQRDLGRTFARMIEAEGRAGPGRANGLEAVRQAFYDGEIARDILDFMAAEGGLLTADDMRDFRVGVEPPVKTRWRDLDVYSCGPWCQGPMLLEFLNLIEDEDLAGLGLNSPDYIHRVSELMKLGFADREAYFGDPEFVDVPLDCLLDKGYARERRLCVSDDRAAPDLPAPGDVGARPPRATVAASSAGAVRARSSMDTTYLCVVDRHGNGFSATPSDGYATSPIIPGLGFAVSPRGDQSWIDEAHPSSVAPWKRPRLTPNPALALKDGELYMVWGTPGGDIQCQAMLQVLLNIVVFGMDPQEAIEQPRFGSASFPDSFYPHQSHPGLLKLEGDLAVHAEGLAARGHDIQTWPDRYWRVGGVCAILVDRARGALVAGADPRRECYALAW